MVESGNNDGPATHAVIFLWNGHEVTNNILMHGSQRVKNLARYCFSSSTWILEPFLVYHAKC